MARIITTTPPPAPMRWQESGKEIVAIALDQNEVEAIRDACRKYHERASVSTHPTSLNGAGARVFAALDPVVRSADGF